MRKRKQPQHIYSWDDEEKAILLKGHKLKSVTQVFDELAEARGENKAVRTLKAVQVKAVSMGISLSGHIKDK